MQQDTPNTTRRVLKNILISLVLVNALCAGLHTVVDPDMGWHLATGRWAVQHLRVPQTDVLSFTTPGKPWMYPPFAGVLFYLIYAGLGYAGLSWFCALVCVAAVGYLARRGQVAAAVLALFATQSIAARTVPRADLFSTLLLVFAFGELWAYQRGTRARLWLLPILLFLWVNLHPGFVAGLASIGAYLLLEAADLSFESRRDAAIARLRKVWPSLGVSVTATLLNPWGWGVYRSALTLGGLGPQPSKLKGTAYVAEFRGIPISTHLLNQLVDVRHIENGFAWLLVVAALLVVVSIWRKQIGPALIVSVALYATLSHARYMGLFAVVIATIGGTLLSDSFTTQAAEISRKSRASILQLPPAVATLFLLAICTVASLHIADYINSRTYIVSGSDWRFGAGISSSLPTRAAEFVRKERLPGNVFEEYALGGFAAWALGPEYPDFIDGRFYLAPDLVAEQRALYTAPPDSAEWQKQADRWNLNVVLISTSGFRALNKLSPAAFCSSASWRPVYMDDVSLVLLRNTAANSPWIQRLQIDCGTQTLAPPPGASRSRLYDFYFDSGALFLALGRASESEKSLHHAAELVAYDPNARILLADLYQREMRLPEAEQQLLAAGTLGGNALYPLAHLYASEGRLPEAVQTLERAATRTVDPTSIYLDIARLELAANHPRQAINAYTQAERSSSFRGGGESLAPGLYSQIAEGRSEAQRLMGHWEEAIRYEQEATRLTPNDPVCWSRLARLYEATGLQTLALEADKRAESLRADGKAQ